MLYVNVYILHNPTQYSLEYLKIKHVKIYLNFELC